MEEKYVEHHDHDSSEWSSESIIIIVVVIIIIIVIIVWYFWSSPSTPTNNKNGHPVWTITEGAGSTSDTFAADNFSIYKAKGSSSGLILILTPPTDPVGKQFIIDNYYMLWLYYLL